MIDKILDRYTEYTGKTLSPEQRQVYTAYVLRAVRMMENKLGWPLDGGSDVADVLGVAPNGCDCRKLPTELNEAPKKTGIYRLFPVDSRKPNLMADPFKSVNAVYLCRIDMDSPSTDRKSPVVILKKMTDITPVIRSTWGKYIKACSQLSVCQRACHADCTNCATLLVDADWITIDDLPPELFFLLFDYIDWMVEGGPTTRSVRSESVDGHSVSYGSWITTAPYYHAADATILRTYAGPYGSIDRKFIS